MAATGYTPVYLYYSSTTTNQPSASNLGYGELAINIADGYLFYKDNANAIQKIGYKLVPVANGGTGASTASITSFNNITGYTASGATGTTSTNLVFSGAPTFTGVAAFAQIRSTYDGSSGSPSLDLRNSNGAQWEWYTPTSDNSLKLDVWVPGQRDNVFTIQNVAGSHNVTVATGNLVIGTSGKGIDFSAASGSVLSQYVTGSYTASVTGLTTAPTPTVYYTRVGNVVTLYIPAISGTSNSTTFSINGAPAIITPSAAKFFIANVQDNGGAYNAVAAGMYSSGNILLFKDMAGNATTASGTKSTNVCTVSYILF